MNKFMFMVSLCGVLFLHGCNSVSESEYQGDTSLRGRLLLAEEMISNSEYQEAVPILLESLNSNEIAFPEGGTTASQYANLALSMEFEPDFLDQAEWGEWWQENKNKY